jgi:hypothetical protein
MGDDGTLRTRHLQDPPPQSRRRHPVHQRTVTRKYVENGRHLVTIEQEAHQQDDELSILGTGAVELPSRG